MRSWMKFLQATNDPVLNVRHKHDIEKVLPASVGEHLFMNSVLCNLAIIHTAGYHAAAQPPLDFPAGAAQYLSQSVLRCLYFKVFPIYIKAFPLYFLRGAPAGSIPAGDFQFIPCQSRSFLCFLQDFPSHTGVM